MESSRVIQEFARAHTDSITNCIYKDPVALTSCRHIVEKALLECRHLSGNFTCPQGKCKSSSRNFIELREMKAKIQDWLRRNPEAFPNNDKLLAIYCIAPIVDSVTRRIFTSVCRLPCGHLADLPAISWLASHIPPTLCGRCQKPFTTFTQDADLQTKINAFIQTHQTWLGFSVEENQKLVTKVLKEILPAQQKAVLDAIQAIQNYEQRPLRHRHQQAVQVPPEMHMICNLLLTYMICAAIASIYFSLADSK